MDHQVKIRGFRIELGSEVIDWTAEGRLEQLKERLTGLKSEGSVIPLIRDAVKSWVPEVCAREVGSVLSVADGIAYVDGLEDAAYGEILLFEGGIRGMVQELRGHRIGCILFGRVEEVSEGSAVYRTGKTAGIGVSDAMIDCAPTTKCACMMRFLAASGNGGMPASAGISPKVPW